MRRRFLCLAVAVTAIAPACDKTPAAPPVAGTAIVSLNSPNEDDGALLITLRGPGVSAAQSASSDYLVYWRLAGEGEIRVLVLGELEPGPLFRVQLEATNRLSEYSATIEQVATRQDMLRTDMSGYGLMVLAQE